MRFLTISFRFTFWTDFQPAPVFDDLPQVVGSVFPAWMEPGREGPAVGVPGRTGSFQPSLLPPLQPPLGAWKPGKRVQGKTAPLVQAAKFMQGQALGKGRRRTSPETPARDPRPFS